MLDCLLRHPSQESYIWIIPVMENSLLASFMNIQTCGHWRMPSWLCFCGCSRFAIFADGKRNFCILCLHLISHRHSRLHPLGASEKHGLTKRLWDHQPWSYNSLLWFKRRMQRSWRVGILSLQYKQLAFVTPCLTIKYRHSLIRPYHVKQHRWHYIFKKVKGIFLLVINFISESELVQLTKKMPTFFLSDHNDQYSTCKYWRITTQVSTVLYHQEGQKDEVLSFLKWYIVVIYLINLTEDRF